MSDYIQLMLQRKINALKRIKDEAENAALNHNFDIDMGNQVKVFVRYRKPQALGGLIVPTIFQTAIYV